MLRTANSYEEYFGHPSANPTARLPAQSMRPIQTALRAGIWPFLAILEGRAAYRRFEHLRSHGVGRDNALRHVLSATAAR